jgi:hypothetical protein
MTTRPFPATIPKAVALLNDLSQKRWGDGAPVYFFMVRSSASTGGPRTYFIHRTDKNISPFLPADVLFSRGSRDHVLAKLHSAIRFAFSPRQQPVMTNDCC